MLNEIVEPLLGWYQKNKRDLPWRTGRNAYHIWISEVMLQQTRVEAVRKYFLRFTEALPTVEALAGCPEDRLLKLWEGLGYYNRARNLKKAAREVVEHYGGVLPADYRLLLKLPGIGSYTAGAIGSIAYDLPVPAVDGNVFRVLTRLMEDSSDITSPAFRKKAETMIREIIPAEAPGEFNQALMELGAVVCVPNGAPACEKCPLQHMCGAFGSGHQMDYPVKSQKKPRRIQELTVLVIQDGERIAFRKRDGKGLLAGLYEFPNLPGYQDEKNCLAWLKQQGLTPLYMQKIEDAKHIFTHVEWRMQAYAVKVAALEENIGEFLFAKIGKAEAEYPLPSAFGAYARYMNMKIGSEGFGQNGKRG